MFPLLEGGLYQEFKREIDAFGQVEPILVRGDVLIDGRNRMRALLELGIEPRIEEYTGEHEVSQYILQKNLQRRSLTPDQRTAIATQARSWRFAEAARLNQIEGGKAAGRGRPKQATANSSKPIEEPKTRERDARSTAGQIATEAKVSHHKAAQAVAVAKAAPDLLDQVTKGDLKLKDAHAKVKAAKSPQPRHEPSYLDDKTKLVGRITDVMRQHQSQHGDLRKSIFMAVEREIKGSWDDKDRSTPEPHQPEEHFDADRVYQRIQAMIESCPKKHLAKFMARLYRATEPGLWQWLKPGDVLIANNETAFIANVARRREKASNNKWPFGAGELIMVAVECLISELSIQQRAELRGKEW